MYELNQIRQFLKVVECGSLLQASDALNMTQPGLSRSMHRLEEELNVPLFVRTKNTISLNETGKKAVPLFRALMEQSQNITETLRAFSRSHETITVLSPSASLFPRLIDRFKQVEPLLKVHTAVANYENMTEALLSEKCQMIMVSIPFEHPDVYNAVFDEESLFLLLPETHPLASKKDGVYLNEMNGETILALDEPGYWVHVEQRLLPDSHFVFQNTGEDFAAVLSSSTLPTFITDSMAETYPCPQGRVCIPLLDELLNLTVYCCCLKKNRERFEPFFAYSD